MAIISDLHCHAVAADQKTESFLIAGARRLPIGAHPVQALIELIRSKELRADVLICPGDLSNKVCSAGMMQAWDHLHELSGEMRCSRLLATLGNHDVDSRKHFGGDPFDIPNNLHPEFPLRDGPDKDCFRSRGFYFARLRDVADFVVLNTVIAHQDESSAKRGTFAQAYVDHLRAALASRKASDDGHGPPIRIAIMHHHPVVHSNAGYDSSDVLEFGDQILGALADYGYRLIIHGHRHTPRITRYGTGSAGQLVFAAGAFSAYLNALSSVTRNLFHLMEVCLISPKQDLVGRINSWEFNHGSGWRPATSQSAVVPYEVGFSLPPETVDLSVLRACCDAAPGAVLRSNELLEKFPSLTLMLPEEVARIQQELLDQGYKLVVNPTGEIEMCGRTTV